MIKKLNQGGNVLKNWVTINEVIAALDLADKKVKQHDAVISNLERRLNLIQSPMHPFQIYAPGFTPTEADNKGARWRKYLVRAGVVNGVEATGTDGVTWPNSGGLPEAGTVTPVEVPAGTERYYFWLEHGPGVAAVQHGEHPEEGWDEFPRPTDTRLLIGYVDTKTYEDDRVAMVRQLVLGDVMLMGGEARWA